MDKVAVCSWSLQPASPADLISKIQACGLSAVQLALQLLLQGDDWANAGQMLAGAGIRIVSGMMGCVGEDYSTISRIRETGGVMPDETWPATRANMLRAAPLAGGLGLSLVTFHAGFIPDDTSHPDFAKAVGRVGEVAGLFAAHRVKVALETGQESAVALAAFLGALGREDVGANFDPANMLLYGSGDPVEALRLLIGRVRQVHIKDAVASDQPGVWGREVAVGSGQVDWPGFFETLGRGDYGGNFVIEREAGGRRIDDVVAAAKLVAEHS